MSRKVSPTLIGAFVAGAVALSVVAVTVFGSGRYFRKTYDFVLYFGSSVNGLRVGAPVKFRGVEVGAVKDIRLQLEPDMQVQRIPVIIEVDPAKLTSRGQSTTILNSSQAFNEAVARGLRGQLQLESLVTGVLFVALDLFPNSPANFVQQPGSHKYQYQEIPTEPTTMEQARGAVGQILAKLAETDFKALVDSAVKALAAIDHLASSPDLHAAVRSSDELTHRLSEAATRVATLATTLDVRVDSLAGDLRLTSAEARTAIKHADEAISRTDATVNDSPTLYELNRTLQEVSAAARSLRLLTGYLERNPKALIFGKPASKSE
jgi:paraquat-inducible protein B